MTSEVLRTMELAATWLDQNHPPHEVANFLRQQAAVIRSHEQLMAAVDEAFAPLRKAVEACKN